MSEDDGSQSAGQVIQLARQISAIIRRLGLWASPNWFFELRAARDVGHSPCSCRRKSAATRQDKE